MSAPEDFRNRLMEAEAVIMRAQDALGPDHDVWWILDDYDGSMDSVKSLISTAREQGRQEAIGLLRAESKQRWHHALDIAADFLESVPKEYKVGDQVTIGGTVFTKISENPFGEVPNG